MSARLLAVGFGFQLRQIWRSPDTAQVCVNAPLYTLVLLAITEYSGRGDLAAYGVVAPTLMALWAMSLDLAGQIITEERILGTLEGLVASPAPLSVLVIGRLAAVTMVGLVAYLEAWLVAGLGFGHWIVPEHLLLFVAAVVLAGLAAAGTASILSSLFVLVPTARTIQNTLTYPLYLLGGVMVPVAFLPDWLRPASDLVFLSWAGDLLRDSLLSAPPAAPLGRLLVLTVLGAAGFAIGSLLLHRVLLRVRRLGTLSET
ncbi:ABC transporter permease [Kitasatospora sp. NPDC058063]|uniref:ABC transporter permease n=1 Tax=unclassified Kitasatospora TaxID=2633591 RepID=UPI0036D8BD35